MSVSPALKTNTFNMASSQGPLAYEDQSLMDKASKGTKGRGADQQNLDFLGETNHHLERLTDLAVPVEKLSPDFLESQQTHVSLKELFARVVTLSEDGQLLLSVSHDGMYCIHNLGYLTNQAELESKAVNLSVKPEQQDLCSFSPDSQYLIIVQSQIVNIVATNTGTKLCSVELESFKQLGPNPKVEIKNTFSLKAAVVGKKQAKNDARWMTSRFFDIRNALFNTEAFFVDINTPRFFFFIGKDAIYVLKLPTGVWNSKSAPQAYFLVPDGFAGIWKDLESMIILDPFVFVTEKKRDRDIKISKLNAEVLKFLYQEESLQAEDTQQLEKPSGIPVYFEHQGSVPIAESRNILRDSTPRCQDWFLYYDIHREELLKVDISKPNLPITSVIYKGDAQNFEVLDNGRLLTVTGLTRESVISIMVFHQHKGSYVQIYEKHSKTFDKKSCIKYMKSQNSLLILWKDRIQRVPIELPRSAQIRFPLCIMNPGNDAPEAYYMRLQRFQKEANLMQITSDGRWMIVYSFFTESLYFLEEGKMARTVDIPVPKVNSDTIGSTWDRGKQPHRIVLGKEEKHLWILTVNLDEDKLAAATNKECLQYMLLSLDLETFQFTDHTDRVTEKGLVLALLPNYLVLRNKLGTLVKYDLKSWNKTEIPHDFASKFFKFSQNFLLVSDSSLTGDADASTKGSKATSSSQEPSLHWLDLDGDLRTLQSWKSGRSDGLLHHDQTDKPVQNLVSGDKKSKDVICSTVVSPDRTQLLVRSSQSLQLVSLSDMSVKVQSHPKLNEAPNPVAEGFSPKGNWVWALSCYSNSLFVFHRKSFQLVLQVPIQAEVYKSQPHTLIQFDDEEKTLFIHVQSMPHIVKIFCLHVFAEIGNIEFPPGCKLRRIWLSSSTKSLTSLCLKGTSQRDFEWLNLNEQVMLTQHDLSIPKNEDRSLMRRVMRNLQMKDLDHADRKGLQETMLNIVKCVPRYLLNRQPVIAILAYTLDEYETFKELGSEVLGIGDLIAHHRFLSTVFDGKAVNSMKAAVELVSEYQKGNFIDESYLQEPVIRRILENPEDLVRDQATMDLFKILMFRKTAFTQTGELVSDDLRVCPVQKDVVKFSDLTMCDSLMAKSSSKREVFQVYQTRAAFSLGYGSHFSSAFFKLIAKFPDDDLKLIFRPFIYYKWNSLFSFCLLYVAVFWTNFAIAYGYLGFHHDNQGLGVAIIVLSSVLLLYEVKSACTEWVKFRSSVWNWYDSISLIAAIFAVIYNFSSSEESRTGDVANVWIRLVPVVALGIRSLTWLRVLRPTRYMIRMVLQVFSDMAPFLVILMTVLALYAYIWRLVGGLGMSEFTPELDFYGSVISATNLIFGSGPDPLGESPDLRFDIIRYLVYVLGNVVLSLVLLNFLIAVISGTHDRIDEDKELHDVKELLEVINDLDLFLRGIGSKSALRQREVTSKFIILIPETEDESALEEQLKSLHGDFDLLRKDMNTMNTSLQAHTKEQIDHLVERVAELLHSSQPTK